MLGIRFMGWQCLTADRAMEHERGRLAHREVNLSIDRQTGKSTLLLAVILRRMLSAPGSWVSYTSASRLSARRKLLRQWWPLIQRSPLGSRFKVTKGTGTETLECSNGSTMFLLAGDETSGHGDSLDLAILDEAWSLTEASEQAVRPTMAARPNGQLWVVSTAGTRRSTYWRAKVEAGRTAAELGVADNGVCFIEWAAAPHVDLTDESTWPAFMPALGRTIAIETVRADFRSMKLSEWRRAYANVWDDDVDDAGWRVISRDAWQASRL